MPNAEQLRQIMPNLTAAKAAQFEPWLNAAMDRFGIEGLLREAAFLAQLAHESGEFRWMQEIWGPTAAQRRYEPPSGKAAELGNVKPGDGKRYMGRGPIQLTGRSNYRRASRDLGLQGTPNDLEAKPELVASPQYGCLCAGLFWDWHDLNVPADSGNFEKITRTINGGLNGYEERKRYYQRALAVLGKSKPPHLTVTWEGQDVTDEVDPYLAAGRVMVALAPMAQRLGLRIVDTKGGNATLRTPDSSTLVIPLAIHEGRGFVALSSLPLHVSWDASQQLAAAEE